MQIEIRSVGSKKYIEVKITDGSAAIDLGLLNEHEAKTLMDAFQSAADELKYFYDSRIESIQRAITGGRTQ